MYKLGDYRCNLELGRWCAEVGQRIKNNGFLLISIVKKLYFLKYLFPNHCAISKKKNLKIEFKLSVS